MVLNEAVRYGSLCHRVRNMAGQYVSLVTILKALEALTGERGRSVALPVPDYQVLIGWI
jgi:archaellum component FlaD/FlaE